MSSSRIYRVLINPRSAFSGEIDSIKVYGAIINAFAEMYGEVNWLMDYIEKGGLRISSPMPRDGDTYYVFKPMLPSTERIEHKDFKKFKRTKYVEENLAMEILEEGAYTPEHVRELLSRKVQSIESEDLPGVAVGRTSSQTQIYYKRAIYSKALWILMEVDSTIEAKIKAVMRYLADVGLSKKRSSGFGHFTVNFEPYTTINKSLKYHMLLSKYIPNSEELRSFPFEQARYDIKLISGYAKDGTVIPRIRALREGSVYPAVYSVPLGRIVEISKNYSLVGVPFVV